MRGCLLRMRALIIAVVVGVAVVVLWSWLDASPPSPTVVMADAPAAAKKTAAPRPSHEEPRGPGPVFTADASIEGDIDDEPEVGSGEKATPEEIAKTLALNAAFAQANVGKFCELADTLSKQPVFKTLQGSRDATKETSTLFGVTEEERTVTLPLKVRQSLMNGTGLDLTEDELKSVDFKWMRSMRDYDRLVGDLGEPMPWGEQRFLPAPKFPYYFVRLRVLNAAKTGDWEDTVKDIEAFATLMHSSGSPQADVEGAKMYELELQTMDQLRASGVKVPDGLPVPSAQQVKLHAAMVNDAFRFVAPGVAPEVQQKAFECAKRAGLECGAALESFENAKLAHAIVETDPQPFDRAGCNPYFYKVMGQAKAFFGPSGLSSRLREPSVLFGALE